MSNAHHLHCPQMAANLSLLSQTQLQQLAHSQQTANQQGYPGSSHGGQWMWGSNQVGASEEPDDSWEVRAFAKDYTGSASGSTWPPRSYTCSFCKREFQSAQALGGHMNVHRRDRVTKRLHHSLLPLPTATAAIPSYSSPSSSSMLSFERELGNFNGELCPLYQLPTQPESSIPSNWIPTTTSYDLLSKAGVSSTKSINNSVGTGNGDGSWKTNSDAEDLDLELRLGHKPFPNK
ncbi:hypothetical protein SAY86_000690 [Trapa natans]|uniref:C2H2-type domain-containing protein n=1 Tax=Trapa natans TaxID=22666 RepID=A0AAN7RFV6_TRANT|nr:hypothetical protein SAY86_000690 [Trapa natans]